MVQGCALWKASLCSHRGKSSVRQSVCAHALCIKKNLLVLRSPHKWDSLWDTVGIACQLKHTLSHTDKDVQLHKVKPIYQPQPELQARTVWVLSFLTLYLPFSFLLEEWGSPDRAHCIYISCLFSAQIPLAIPFKIALQSWIILKQQTQLLSHRFLQWKENLRFTLHQEVITIHLIWSLERGLLLTMWALVWSCPLDWEQKEVSVVADECVESAWG